MKTTAFYLSVLCFVSTFLGFSQNGTLDSSFGNDGIVITDFYGESDGISSIVQLSNGEILALGNFSNQSVVYNTLTKYLSNGDLDMSYGTNGFKIVDYGNPISYFKTLRVQNDDKTIVSSTITNNDGDFLIARHLPDGNLDATFGINGVVITDIDDEVLKVSILQNDGKILAFGTSHTNGIYSNLMVRYLSNGELDLDFGNNGIVLTDFGGTYFNIISAEVQENGLINLFIINGSVPNKSLQIIQFFEEGTLDTTFGNDGIITIESGTDFSGGAMKLKNDGSFIISYTKPFTLEYKLKQYFSNGSLDTSFGTNGEVNINIDSFSASKIFIQEDENILIYGKIAEFEGSRFCLLSYQSNGELDIAFGENGLTTLSFESKDVIIQNDGKILGAGSTYWYNGNSNFLLARYNNNPLGISENEFFNFSVFPNPSNGIFNISHSFITSGIVYQISDITGKLIQQGKLYSEQTQIDISQFEKGVYLFTSEGSTVRLLKN